MSLPNITLTSATTGTLPFTIGHAFKQGDVPAGQSVVCAGAGSFQAISRNVWPDGSLKIAILSGTASITADTPLSLPLSLGAANAGAALTLTALKATGVTAAIDAGAFGSATWAGTDWDTPFQTWVSGPVMSSWVYRKPVGSDAHLVAWLEVKLYASGAVEVLPWIENGYVNVAGPTNKSATYTFTLAGTQRFSADINLLHHQRTVLISGTYLSHWVGADPQITPLHDTTYMQTTELVPTYSATPASTLPDDRYSIAGFAPLQQGDFKYGAGTSGYGGVDDMTDTGYGRPIGLMPEWEVLHLTCRTKNTYNLVIRNGYSVGRYGIHYRDEVTNRPLRFSDYPTMTIRDGQGFNHAGSSTTNTRTPVISGSNPPTWDTAHSPSVGLLAYLLTGRWYFVEEAQFAATANYLGDGSGNELREGSKGIVKPCVGAWQMRDAAWMWRALVQAMVVTPDSDTALKTEFKNSIQANIDHFHGRYVAQANNPFGIIENGSGYPYYCNVPIWQQDFVTASFGYSLAQNFALDAGYSTKLNSFFQWTAKSITGRLATFAESGWPYVNAAVYLLNISSTGAPNWAAGTGPWHADWATVYANQSFVTSSFGYDVSWFGTTDGTLHGEIMPGANSQWGNAMTALAYAVRHNVAGAATGLARIQAASNYSALSTQFNTLPVWSVAPASVSTSIPVEGTPGMGKSLLIDTSDDNGAGGVTIGDTGLGVLGATVRANTATGTHGQGLGYNDWDSSADDDKEFWFQLETPPSAGKLTIFDDGSIAWDPQGAVAGSYNFTYRLRIDGVSQGVTTATILYGASAATVAATGIASSEAFGSANVLATGPTGILPAGIPSAEAFGSVVVQTTLSNTANVLAVGIESMEAFGTASLSTTGDGASSDSALTATEQRLMYGWVRDLAMINGLVAGVPVTVQRNKRRVGSIEQDISGSGTSTVTVTRV
jgi:hypothetical protein